jgi:hypothetical protein
MAGHGIKPIVLVIRSQLTGSREKPEMTRYERKLYFERLMALRDAYRAEVLETSGMTIEQAMTFAEQTYNDAADADMADAATITASLTNGAAKAG